MRVALFVGLAVAVLVVVRTLPLDTLVGALRSSVEASGPIGMIGFGAAFVVLALLFVPGAALSMVAGAVFGVGWGIGVVAIATSVADAAAFLTGRYVARSAVMRLMDRYPRFKIVDRTISRGGWRIVALIRLSPAFPYSVSNYLGYVGAEAFGGSSRNPVEWAMLVMGLVVTIIAIAYVTVLARRGLAELE